MASADTAGIPRRFIDPSAAAGDVLPDFARDPGELTTLYRAMVLTRAFDAKAVALKAVRPARSLVIVVRPRAIIIIVAVKRKLETRD